MKTVLLIDDDDRLRHAFAEALRGRGYRVLEAPSGSKGLEIARRQMPDLILTDINMPGGGGHDLLREIRQDSELSTRQVVLMTGDASAVTLRHGMEMGADDFLLKPVHLDELVRCVAARLDRAETHWRVEDRMLRQLRHSLQSTLPHEFFTPLAGILGLTGILRSDYSRLSPAEIGEIHQDIYRSGLRLHRTLRNYLEILELESAPPGIQTLPAPLHLEAIHECLEKGIRFATERNDRHPDLALHSNDAAICVTPADLTLIVEELVDNGCRFSRAGTPVTVEVTPDGVLTVTDAGRGLSPEEIERIGAFRQFDRKTAEKQGLGLGLILVKKLAEKCGAAVSIESPVEGDGGTRVRIAFRRAEEDAPAPG